MIIERFSKYLTSIEYPKNKTSWNIAGVLNGKNAFYKFDVRGMMKESENRAYKTGRLNSKADKIELKDLISHLEWNIILPKF